MTEKVYEYGYWLQAGNQRVEVTQSVCVIESIDAGVADEDESVMEPPC